MSIFLNVPRESWVLPSDHYVQKSLQQGNNFHWLLSDTQVRYRTGILQTHKHFVIKIRKPADFNSINPLNIVLNDSYETCSFHSLQILRDGERIDKLSEIRFMELQREQELEQNVLSGLKTYLSHIEDLRIGDFVSYDFTIESKNKIYEKHFTYYFQYGFFQSVGQVLFSLDYENDLKSCKVRQIEKSLPLLDDEIPGGSNWKFQKANTEAMILENNIPPWYEPFPYLQFSDYQDWEETKDYLSDYYCRNEDFEYLQPQVQRLLESESSLHPIEKLVDYVQKEIHYQSISMDEHSFLPHAPSEVFAKKFGDCKDKSLLLKCLLQLAGFSSVVVLVNSFLRKEVKKKLISLSNFNHAILCLEYGGRNYLIDPTDSYDCFSLKNPAEKNWGYGLFLDEKIKFLPIESTESVFKRKIKEIHRIEGDVAYISLTDTYYLLSFSEAYSGFAENDLEQSKKNYLKYFSRRYLYLELVDSSDAGYILDRDAHSIEWRCLFKVSDYWQKQDAGQPAIAFYCPDQLTSLLPPYEDAVRHYPHSFPHKVEFEYRFDIEIDYDVNLGNLDGDFSGNTFEAKIRSKQTSPRTYEYIIHFLSRKNCLTPEEWQPEKKALNNFLKLCGFHLTNFRTKSGFKGFQHKVKNFFEFLFGGKMKKYWVIVLLIMGIRFLAYFGGL